MKTLQRLDVPVLVFMAVIHLTAAGLCIAFPSWSGVALGIVLYFLTGFGITVGYHRLLTHRSFQASAGVTGVLALLGVLAGEGPPIFWVAHHRKHHRHSDGPEDPHSPVEGFWWSHWLWVFHRRDLEEMYARFAPDMMRNRVWVFLEHSYIFWQLGLAFVLFYLGYLVGGLSLGLSWLGYGWALRMIVVLHATWLVNSAAHTWGYQSYPTPDQSRNNAAVALISLGEGWHNNHHHAPAAANHGHRWWEVDLSYLLILAAARLRWVSHVKVFERRTGRTTTRYNQDNPG